MTSQIFRPTANFENFEIHLYFVCHSASLPAVRPGCARCRAPESGGFTKILFRRRFTHCAMTIPFILHFFPCSLCIFSKVRISPKVMIACNGFCLLRHTKIWLARDVAGCFCELRDYSIGQIAFAVFRALFAITQLLCHVSTLLTNACKQA